MSTPVYLLCVEVSADTSLLNLYATGGQSALHTAAYHSTAFRHRETFVHTGFEAMLVQVPRQPTYAGRCVA
jgi:hypothetical protein